MSWTGVVFARGSCRALKWMALVGVVLALVGGSAIAQPAGPRDFDAMPTAEKADGTGLDTANTDTAGAVLLTWREPSVSRTVTGYQWSSDGGGTWAPSDATTRNANLRATELEALTAGREYIFALRAVHDTDQDGTPGEAGEISNFETVRLVVIGIPPNPAYKASFPKAADEHVTLEWTATATATQPVESYEYRYGLATEQSPTSTDFTSGGWSRWMKTEGTSATVSGLANGSRYAFEVRAVNKAGMSATPVAGAAIPASLPSEPQGLQADTSGGDGQVVLTWTAPSSNGGSALTAYEYRVRDGSAWRSPPTALGTTVTLRDLTPRRLHIFDVRAVNAIGPGPVATVEARPTGEVQPPTAPRNLTVDAGNRMVTLAWMEPADDGGAPVTSYQYEMDGSGTWMDVGLVTTRDVTDLRNGQDYTFRVRAVNRVGEGEPSASMPGRPAAQVPSAPLNLTATAGDMMVTLSWTAPASDGGDSIIRYEYNADGSGTWTSTGQQTTATVTGLTNGQLYNFGVRAVNDAGAGATASVAQRPVGTPVPDVTVKSVTSDTSVAEAGGLTVTVTMNVPAGTKGADDKVAPIASKMVYVDFHTDDASILARDESEADDTTLLGTSSANMYTWTKIPQTEKASEVKRTFRVAIGQDLDAEDEKFQVSVQIDGDPKRSKVITIDDAEDQKFKLTLESDHKEKNTIEEGDSGTLKLVADPDKTVSLDVKLVLHPDDPAKSSKYTLSPTSASLAAGGAVTATVSAEADGDREPDTVTVAAYITGALGNDEMLPGAELEITVADINALPAIEATIVDDKGKALDPQPESVMEGETVKVMLTVVDKDGKAMEAAEKLTVSLMPSSGSSQDYRLSTHPIVIDSGKESSASVELMIEADDDVGMEMLVFDASVAGDAKIGGVPLAVNGVLSLAIEDGTQKLVYAKTQEEVEAAIYAAMEAGMGDDMVFNPGEMIEVMGNDLFSSAEGVTLTYTAESDHDSVATTSVGGGMVMVTAGNEEGMAHITITAHASMPSGARPLPQTDPREASVIFPVEVGLAALSIELMGPEDMNLVEGGMGGMVTATANREVTEDVTVMLMRDRAMSTASDDDYMADAITIMAGEMSGSTMVMAVEDDMMENMNNMPEELVLYGMTENNAGPVTGEVKFYLWDAAVPALPVIAQLLLAAFLAVGGYRRYRRR